jgi:putative ABC transport system permease protein
VRLALGAQRSQVRTLFLKQGAMLVLAGGAVGLAAALVVGRLLGAILFQTAPADPLSAMATVAILVVIGIAAICIPAQRASQVDPMTALRAE